MANVWQISGKLPLGPGSQAPGPLAQGPGPLGPGAQAPWPRGPGALAQGPGPLGPGARAPWPRGPGSLGPRAQATWPKGPGTLAQGTLRTGFMNRIEPEPILTGLYRYFVQYVPECAGFRYMTYRILKKWIGSDRGIPV